MSAPKITSEQAYQCMLHFLNHYYREVEFDEETILSWAAYKKNSDEPRDLAFKYKWDEIVETVLNGRPPLRGDNL
jgi:hypothetical protein